MNLSDYFTAVKLENISLGKQYASHQLGNTIHFELSDYDAIDIAIFDVQEDRRSDNHGCSEAGMKVRKYLYQLFQGDYKMRVVDLGSIEPGNSVNDTYFALQEVTSFLMRKQILPIIIGGSQDLTLANYKAYGKMEQYVNLVSIDAKFPLGDGEEELNSSNYFSKLLFEEPSILFNYSNLGYQGYFVDKRELEVVDELFFDIHRLGVLKSDIKMAEPILRNADFISFNLSAIAQPYLPANINASPNGFSGEQACQLARYAGMSDKLTSIGFYELNSRLDESGMSSHLLAQMIWYFIDGFYNRKQDFPACNKNQYIKYTVPLEGAGQEVVFYKSPKSDRWWMEVPYPEKLNHKYKRHLLLPCTYEEYLTATKNEIPERWFQTFQKLK